MNYSLMEILIVAFIICFLIRLFFYLFFEKNKNPTEKTNETNSAISHLANEIKLLNKQLDEKKKQVDEKELLVEGKNDFEKMLGKNIPIIEITDLELSEEINGETEEEKINKTNYIHQLRFYVFNVGKSSLKDVIVSIKDIYNDPKDIKKRSRTIGQHDDESFDYKNYGIGTFENVELKTLNLKSRQLVYVSTLPSSFGVAEYVFNVVVEWKNGYYQMEIKIEEFGGKLKYIYQYFDNNDEPINFELLENGIKK